MQQPVVYETLLELRLRTRFDVVASCYVIHFHNSLVGTRCLRVVLGGILGLTLWVLSG